MLNKGLRKLDLIRGSLIQCVAFGPIFDLNMKSMRYVDTSNFEPPFGLRNPHVQTIFSSVGPRRFKVKREFSRYKKSAQQLTLNCGDGVRLAGSLIRSNTTSNGKLAILIHGWEGSQDSSYMLSMTSQLLSDGIDVFRLNLRDHGDTHHLNEGIFNSTLIDEVIGGIEDLQRKLQYSKSYLVGFSLGGNFGLRVAALAHGRELALQSVIAFCPVIHAASSNVVLNSKKNWIYGRYFVRKWKNSLRKKLQHFPDYGFANDLSKMQTLQEMNQQLVPVYTPFKDLDTYFDAYAISGERLTNTICPCYLHFAKDDMIIPVEGVSDLADNPDLHITISDRGGHCGFLKNWQFDSWQDQRAAQLISES